MNDKNLKFFAMQINGTDAALFVTAEEAIEAICDHVAVCDEDTYTVAKVDGIWELVQRLGAFEGYQDDWMEYVLDIATGMVEDAKRRAEAEQKEKEETTKEAEQ